VFNKPGELESYNFDCDFDKIKRAEPKILPDKLKLYVEYQWERTKIYYKKEVLKDPYPWTYNKILREYRFTNTRRELDRESKWLIDNILNKGDSEISYENKILNSFLFRIINKGSAMELLFPEKYFDFSISEKELHKELQHIDKLVDKYYSEGVSLQNDAYMISGVARGINWALEKRFKKVYNGVTNRIWYIYLQKDFLLDLAKNKNPWEYNQEIKKIAGFNGKFIDYQVWVDLTYIGAYTPKTNHFYPYSENTFVVSGPGCDKGILWMVGNNPDNLDGLSFTEFLYWFRDNLPELCKINDLPWNPNEMFGFLPENQRQWGLMQIENSFCEFDKFNRLQFSEKRSRNRKYKPEQCGKNILELF